jgi:hypothetical protein
MGAAVAPPLRRIRVWAAAPAALALTLTLTSLAASGLGCETTIGAVPLPPPQQGLPAGTAIMDWTIDGAKDPGQCQAQGAATFHIALYDSSGAFAGEFVQDCSAFATTVGGLIPDTYTGRADLLDASGRARTTFVDLAPFDVVEAATVTVPLDFPSTSFY